VALIPSRTNAGFSQCPPGCRALICVTYFDQINLSRSMGEESSCLATNNNPTFVFWS